MRSDTLVDPRKDTIGDPREGALDDPRDENASGALRPDTLEPSRVGRLSEEPTALVGMLLSDRYLIRRFIARGGMGAVYAGYHVVLQTEIAIKIVHIQSRAGAEARFLREARLACSARHANLVQIMDCGLVSDGCGYVIMELLHGQTLASCLAEGRMDPLRACQIAAQIARGLIAIHERGIVHCDMKPRNVLLVQQGEGADCAKIIDFGIAKSITAVEAMASPLAFADGPLDLHDKHAYGMHATTHSSTGIVAGTPHYMSPEQCQGQTLDGRSDMYSLGCMLYEMLAGTVPFDKPSVREILEAHVTAPVPPLLSHAARTTSRSLEQLVLRMLAKDPALRFSSIREVEHLLRQEADLLCLQRGEKVLWEREYLQWLVHRHRNSRRPQLGNSALLRSMVALIIALMSVRLGSHMRPILPPEPPLPRPPRIAGTLQPFIPDAASMSSDRCASFRTPRATAASALTVCNDGHQSDAVPASASLDVVNDRRPAPRGR